LRRQFYDFRFSASLRLWNSFGHASAKAIDGTSYIVSTALATKLIRVCGHSRKRYLNREKKKFG
jgi:hypothetical protein